MAKVRIRIKGDKSRFVYTDRLRGFMDRAGGEVETVRASSVEPEGDGWAVQMHPEFGGQKLPGVHRKREDALDAEREHLRKTAGL